MDKQKFLDDAVRAWRADPTFGKANDGSCCYLTPEGNKCLIGKMLPSDILEEVKDIEDAASDLADDSTDVAQWLDEMYDVGPDDALGLLDDVQGAHDNGESATDVLDRLRYIARGHGLEFPEEGKATK